MLGIGNIGETSQLPAGATMERLSTSCARPCWSLPSFLPQYFQRYTCKGWGSAELSFGAGELVPEATHSTFTAPYRLRIESFHSTTSQASIKPKSSLVPPLSLDSYDVNILVWQARPLRSRRDQSERPFLYTEHVAIGSPHRGFSFLF